ncbi:MAG TPA: class I SAM-dependent methyltransferase [Spirochaetota bacterium]|nr:class I SAM-dependent methyltransferase [Spirochaetota bacterium]HQF10440.1 class I SAM-dependent methyltransferase [Spirochaetota bacterium]HQH99339.1 class I SAM-dependent methyltransferase [Spirochaetota bacterium]HQJ73122.1 class I SAM-dependent methyltransferase [Spirochaetota bacterium]
MNDSIISTGWTVTVTPAMETVNCVICGSPEQRPLFEKASRTGILFTLVRCPVCGLQYVSPRPGPDEIGAFYSESYFTERTDRGYNDYFSEKTRLEIERVIRLNLRDLGFFEFEKGLGAEKRVLDIGCAAGYFLSLMNDRGWETTGVDISPSCVEFARGAGIAVYEDDYLEIAFARPFDLITLWASIEHLHYPDRFIEKARDELKPGGRLFISTCRAGGLNFMRLYGKDWRFYNFPEHLYFFSRPAIKKLLEGKGFRIVQCATYGSGFGKAGSFTRKIADIMAKRLRLGDMMLIAAEKV